MFALGREGAVRNIYQKAADGTGETQRLTTDEADHFPFSWSSDGTTLLFVEGQQETLDLAVLTMDNDLEFSGATAPAGPAPWMTAFFDDNTGNANSVDLVMAFATRYAAPPTAMSETA